jgi:phosphoglucosamine mutase
MDYLAHNDVQDAKKEAEAGLGKTGRVLLRKSGTEPLIRVMVESNDESQSHKWAEHIAETVRNLAN